MSDYHRRHPNCNEAEMIFLGCLKISWTDPPICICAECPPWGCELRRIWYGHQFQLNCIYTTFTVRALLSYWGAYSIFETPEGLKREGAHWRGELFTNISDKDIHNNFLWVLYYIMLDLPKLSCKKERDSFSCKVTWAGPLFCGIRIQFLTCQIRKSKVVFFYTLPKLKCNNVYFNE